MAESNETASELDEEAELEDLEREIGDLRLAKKQLFAKARPINDELEGVARRERECVDKLNRLRSERDAQQKHLQTVEHLRADILQLQRENEATKSQNEALSCENEALKRENAERAGKNSQLRRSLNEAAKYSRQQMQQIKELKQKISAGDEPRSTARHRYANRGVTRSQNVGWTHVASSGRDPITDVCGRCPLQVQGQIPVHGVWGVALKLKNCHSLDVITPPPSLKISADLQFAPKA